MCNLGIDGMDEIMIVRGGDGAAEKFLKGKKGRKWVTG
jgi:hypothetical protein